ncbi:zinc ribbon domain-containing protein [Clostridium sp. DJ247]|uniref:zinc ribbon domain-containing protein n=1 Tax=Clostridium sp. DJ247 TaxID=2726188 RepID=UPI00162A808C|nr:zinc ribbon domain-containing protein [Clostridium sp. DJ247]MBC2582116.1 zinc ribbon domain-containing protein [Clostridium sp. DJ247]
MKNIEGDMAMSINDKLKIIKISLKEGADSALKKSKNFIECSDLSLSIASCEKEISELYEQIGKQIYDMYKDGKDNNKEIVKLCDKIKEVQEEITELRTDMLKLKNKKNCKHCSYLIDKKARYCEKCGRKQ